MFAVIILGIGFIMVAALFPVALQQTQATSQDVAAAAYGNSISQGLSSVLSSSDLPATGESSEGAIPCYASLGPIQGWAYSKTPQNQAIYPPMLAPFTIDATGASSPFLTGVPLTAWNKISGIAINATDPHYGWVGFYSRDETATTMNSYINVIAIVTQNSAGKGYQAVDLNNLNGGATTPATLQGFPISVRVIDTGAGLPGQPMNSGLTTADLLLVATQNAGAAAANQNFYDAVATGAFVIISQDMITMGASPTQTTGHYNGRIFRVGARRADLDPTGSPPAYEVWELQSGNDFTPDVVNGTNYNTIPYLTGTIASNTIAGAWANAFVVGRALLDPTYGYSATSATSIQNIPTSVPHPYAGQNNAFTGSSQAVAAYTFTVSVQ